MGREKVSQRSDLIGPCRPFPERCLLLIGNHWGGYKWGTDVQFGEGVEDIVGKLARREAKKPVRDSCNNSAQIWQFDLK